MRFLMKNNRLRQPTDPDYMHALGTAAFCFAICEWNAVYCAERIRPGSLGTFIKDELTAGKIAKKLIDLTRNMPETFERDELIAAAQAFAASRSSYSFNEGNFRQCHFRIDPMPGLAFCPNSTLANLSGQAALLARFAHA